MIIDSISHYDTSQCRKSLKSRTERLRNSAMLKFKGFGGSREKFLSIAMPVVKEQMLTTRASIRANFRSPQFWTVVAEDNADKENARNAEMLMTQNSRATRWSSKAWQQHTEILTRYGASVNYCAPVSKFEKSMQPVQDPFYGITYQETEKEILTAYNGVLDPLNYGQDPEIASACDAPYQFHRERIHISELKRRLLVAIESEKLGATNPWDTNILMAKLEQLKGGYRDEKYYSGSMEVSANGERRNSHYYDLVHWFGVLPIEGNEASNVLYYAVVLDGEIVRFQARGYSQESQYSILRTDPHDMYWWGSPQAEYRVPHENFLNTHVNATYDQLLKSMKQYVFYDKNSGIPENLQQIMPWGGMVPVDAQNDRRVSDIFSSWQPNPVDLNSSNAITQLVEQQMRNTSARPELTRSSGQRAVAANTATGAELLQQQGDLMQSDYLEQIANGLENVGEVTYNVLKEVLPPIFTVTGPKSGTLELTLMDIMGAMRFQVHSSLTKNRRSELTRYQNALTWWLNLAGTGHPAFQDTDPRPIYREVWRMLDVGDVDEIVPEEPEQTQPDMMQQGQPPQMQQPQQPVAQGVPGVQ